MRTSTLLLAAAALLCYAAVAAAATTGGWKPVDNVTDPHVQELGRWAVKAHGRVANTRLMFHKVVSGEMQLAAGVNYRLHIEALRLDGKDAMYKAEVFERDDPITLLRKLISFEPAAAN